MELNDIFHQFNKLFAEFARSIPPQPKSKLPEYRKRIHKAYAHNLLTKNIICCKGFKKDYKAVVNNMLNSQAANRVCTALDLQCESCATGGAKINLGFVSFKTGLGFGKAKNCGIAKIEKCDEVDVSLF